ncbi:MAG: FtsQ-type POTRA domain-containing protein [Deltaproteobacteria bacterium]|uniref:cell division protein FtsQ/DivIB n=1 Tax=Desulfobacula sp. TaxID=2593537 RepID=UPI00198553C8|nr:FtsQ-type POTRA domain-containing protein [Candidatus Desulfobacula maris]MBL6995197.1 FtsQ-type POTRA domain-containing protein [Desulfobacula sp.]
MSKKIQPNRYKPEAKDGKHTNSQSNIAACLKYVMTLLFISALSFVLIFIYDFITQSPSLNIKTIEISGTNRVLKEDILKLADLTFEKNILEINLFSIEKRLISHPWIQSARVKRNLDSVLSISITEHEPLAIVKIENLADILINTQGHPFKEYSSLNDNIKNLPVVTGLDLASVNNQYLFNGTLFNSTMDFLQSVDCINIKQINGNKNTGVTIEARDIYNRQLTGEQGIIQIKLGFDDFKAKLTKAKNISEYIDKNFPEKIICSMDLFNIKKVFIKTKLNNALHNDSEKGA